MKCSFTFQSTFWSAQPISSGKSNTRTDLTGYANGASEYSWSYNLKSNFPKMQIAAPLKMLRGLVDLIEFYISGSALLLFPSFLLRFHGAKLFTRLLHEHRSLILGQNKLDNWLPLFELYQDGAVFHRRGNKIWTHTMMEINYHVTDAVARQAYYGKKYIPWW